MIFGVAQVLVSNNPKIFVRLAARRSVEYHARKVYLPRCDKKAGVIGFSPALCGVAVIGPAAPHLDLSSGIV
jgi:hypothetical protein